MIWALMRVSVVIPVYNERVTLEALLAKVDAVDVETELIIVDDDSTDGTRDLLSAMTQSDRVVVFRDTNQGKGAALRTGLDRASGEYVVQDADLDAGFAIREERCRTSDAHGRKAKRSEGLTSSRRSGRLSGCVSLADPVAEDSACRG